MKYLVHSSNLENLKHEETDSFTRNGWISPKGDFYCCGGAEHHRVAKYIGVFILNKDQSVLKSGRFFKELFDDYLFKVGWARIKDGSWIGYDDNLELFFTKKELSQKQTDTLFDYCNYFNKDLKKLLTSQQ